MFKKTKVKSATKISQELRGTTNNLHESPSLGRKNKFSEESQNGDWVDCAQGFRLQLIKLATVTDVSHGAVRGPVIGDRRARDSSKEAFDELLGEQTSQLREYRAAATRRIAARKQKSHFSKTSVNTEDNASKTGSKDARLTSNLPKDAAVHFGNFYGVHESTSKPRPGKIEGSSNHGSEPTRTTPRLEFTRQMVHKLERTAGTEEYARQVSALLEETVEPAHFRLHSLPTENSIPEGGRQNPSGYPLWYKEPYKTPLAQAEICKLLKSEQALGNSKDIFDEELSEKGSTVYVTDEEDNNDPGTEQTIKAPESVANLLSSVSSSATETKESDYTSSDSR